MIKNFVYLSIFTTFVVLVWISLTIFHAFNSSTITQDVNIQIEPLAPNFNINVVPGLKKRKQIIVNLESNLSTPSAIAPETNASPIVTINPTPTGISPVQTGTSSGELTSGF